MEALKIVLDNAYEDHADSKSDPPAGFAKIPLYSSFLNQPEDWERIHVHLSGVRPERDDQPTSRTDGIKSLSSFLTSVNPSVKVETVGKDTGSTDYFDVGVHSFTTKKNAVLPCWDERIVLMYKKGNDHTSGLQLTMTNESTGNRTTILKTTIDREKLPQPGAGWQRFEVKAEKPEEKKQFGNLRLLLELKVTSGTDKIVSKKDIQDICKDTKTHNYTEEVLKGDDKEPDDNALLQCWQHKQGARKAVLWIIGRNDCFMHPHVAKELFFCQGYDLYVLNWSSNGMCRKRGWMTNPFMNSHNRTGNADLYLPQIDKALKFIRKDSDEKVLGCAHSTGACLLVHYLMHYGDSAFSGFILNSPMFDLAQIDPIFPSVEKLVSLLDTLGINNKASAVLSFLGALSYGQMDGLKKEIKNRGLDENDFKYLGQDIEFAAWNATVWSQYDFDGRSRTFYRTPITVGFLQFVAQVTRNLDQMHKEQKHLTLKPIICFSTRLDDTLSDFDLLHERVNTMGPSRLEIQMRHANHDIFRSEDMEDNMMAIEMIKTWMMKNSLS